MNLAPEGQPEVDVHVGLVFQVRLPSIDDFRTGYAVPNSGAAHSAEQPVINSTAKTLSIAKLSFRGLDLLPPFGTKVVNPSTELAN